MVDRLDKLLDDSEQYSRRVSLRIHNIPALQDSEDDNCIDKVVTIMEKLDCSLPASDTDRAHRVRAKNPGKVKGDVTGSKQQMIVQFM